MSERPRVGDRVYGASWRRQGARRQHAARIARSLRPVAHLLGGLVSTELTVAYRGRWHRPDVGVLVDRDVPADGVLAAAPTLVVRLGGPLTGTDWLAAGAEVVWASDDGGSVEQLTRRGRRRLAPGQWLLHPGEPALRLAADDLAVGAAAGARTAP